MLNRLSKFGLTKQDLVVTAFLIITFIAGLVINLSGWKNTGSHDYSSPDLKFEQQLKQNFSELPKQNLSQSQNEKAALIKSFSDSLLQEKDEKESEELKQKFDKKININLAYSADLQRLPGIGEVMADRIIDYREQNGNYRKIEDVMKVKGIGVKKFEKIKDLITVE